MKIFCITGSPGSDLNIITNILTNAGISPPKPSSLDKSLTLPEWHQRVLAAANDDAAPLAIQQPGRLWEQLASSIFLENMQTPFWGWADSSSTWLLDFWREFEPNLHFLLVYTSPQRALAQALSKGLEHDRDVADLLASWQLYQQEILRFHHRHPQRTLLVDAAQCAAHPEALISACAKQWNLKLPPVTSTLSAFPSASPLPAWLAEQMRQTQPQLQALQNELEASLHTLVPVNDTLTLNDAIGDFRVLHERASQIDELSQKLASHVEQRAALDIENQHLNEENQQRQKEALQLQAEILALRKENAARGQSIHDLNGKISEYHSALADLTNQLTEKQTQCEIHEKALQNHTQLNLEHNQLLDQLQTANSALKNSQMENAALSRQLEQVQVELEQSFLQNKTRAQTELDQSAHLTQLNEQIADNHNKIDAQNISIRSLTQKLESLSQESEQLHEAKKENGLLLLQLHQVQSELEHYFLQFQQSTFKQKELEAQWQRMLTRSPGYCDYQSIDVSPFEDDTHLQGLNWRITKLNAAGRIFPEVQFRTVHNDDGAGFVFTAPEDSKQQVLLRWPEPGSREIFIAINHDSLGHPCKTLLALGTSDLTLLQVLCGLLCNAIESGTQLPAGYEVDALRASLHEMQDILTRLPATLRFDQVKLKREQVNPDYEHLWFEMSNFSFGSKSCPLFEFRLSCANVRPKRFGTHPKLEFPADGGRAPLENWFDESCDDFGEKLELRFALPDAMDINVWNALSSHDRALVNALLANGPALLSQLESIGNTLSRPWQDWQQMTLAMQQILKLRSQPPAADSGAVPEPQALKKDAPTSKKNRPSVNESHSQVEMTQ